MPTPLDVLTCGCECHRGQRTTGQPGHCNYNGGCGAPYGQPLIADHHTAYATALAARIADLLSVVPTAPGMPA